jgi:chromate reductase, NAD(P)H dehydrogenase (quinone)
VNSRRIGVLVGSLRRESISRRAAKALIALAPESLTLEIINLGDLPLYNQDLEDAPPTPWTAFRDRIKALDGVLFVTPEYNRSVPAVLKNAIDVGSRPRGHNVWDGKPGAVVSVTPGLLGAFGAHHHLRQSLVCVGVPTMVDPEAYIGGAAALFDDNGNVLSDSTGAFFKTFMANFARWVERNPKL